MSRSLLTVILYSAAWVEAARAANEMPSKVATPLPGFASAQPGLRFLPASGEREKSASSVQRKHEQVARVFQVVVFHRVQMASARLHREILLRPDRVDDG